MRLFIAIHFEEETRNHLMNAVNRVKKAARKGTFTPLENLHLTVVFLGETAPTHIDRIKAIMDTVEAEPFTLETGPIGSFKRDDGDLYWLGVEHCPALSSLYRGLCEGLAQAGFATEKRELKPHLTLGRRVVIDDAEKAGLSDGFGTVKTRVNGISLMKSENVQGKPLYIQVYKKDWGDCNG